MLISEILFEMPVRAAGALQAKFVKHRMPYSDIENFFVIETDANVTLLLDDETAPKTILFTTINDDTHTVEVIGRLYTSTGVYSDLAPPKTIVEHIITIDASMKGRGIGVSVYKALIEHGFSIISDGVHFEDAFWFWKKLIRLSPRWGVNVYLIKDGDFVRGKNGMPKIVNTRTNEKLIWDQSSDRLLLTRQTLH